MKRTTVLILSLILVGFLTSCSRDVVCNIYNNTGKNIRVIAYDTQNIPTEYTIKPGFFEEISFPTALKILNREFQWSYEWTGLTLPRSGNYVRARSAGPLQTRFQVNADGTIYFLDNQTEAPFSQAPPQPEGFPLKPTPVK
jgi:hypothetical protein